MALNRLDNFLKNTEGRILYVNPNDLDSTDSIDNQGNSLARPFKTIQRAIIEAARFSYIRGNNNDSIEKTTILLFPAEYIVDNRPGYAIYDNAGAAYAVPRSGGIGAPALSTLSLDLDSNFDLTQEDNILYKFNSFYGGVILPRGISIVGLDLRKTKIRPLYVPNPTDSSTDTSAIFRLTGTCYIWQVSFFDGDSGSLVYTDPNDFSSINQSVPLFSHHKLHCFEYADGVNNISNYGLTDLDMYYSKISNAFNSYREIESVDKFPENPDGFAKRDPEWQIVGAFASDPISISDIVSGNGTTPTSRITVTTSTPHNLNTGTPIKILGVDITNYNISTTVQEVISETEFTYLLPSFPVNLNPNPGVSSATVIVETDTVTGASPYIFNCSLRSVWGMNGILADGSKTRGFRSMVVAQFTGVSLQKDDRAFVKYDPVSRTYNGVNITATYGSNLPLGASQTDPNRVYHLDPDAIYRPEWVSNHIEITNDAFIQVVSVFAIGFNSHFKAASGADVSITNSNSNFGQIALESIGFKKNAFAKDDNAFITSIVNPRSIDISTEETINWLPIDVGLTTSVGNSQRLYLFGYTNPTSTTISSVQGYTIGAKLNDILYVNINNTLYQAPIVMDDGTSSSKKEYDVLSGPTSNIFTLGTHTLQTGEKVIIRSDTGDLPENLSTNDAYYVIRTSSTQIKLASSLRNAENDEEISVYGGVSLKIISRVSDKASNDIGSPVMFDASNNNWYITVGSSNTIYPALNSQGGVAGIGDFTDISYIRRIDDNRSIDEKLYKVRVVVPKEAINAKTPEAGYVIQESNTTGVRSNSDFSITSITQSDFNYKRNLRYIVTASTQSNIVTITSERPHNLTVGDIINIKNVKSSTNTIGQYNLGYNGEFRVLSIVNDLVFTYSIVDTNGESHNTGVFTNNKNIRTIEELPRYEIVDNKTNLYIYRNEIISSYIEGVQDGIYNLYVLNSSNSIEDEFTDYEYSQNVVNLYPQLDRDNINDNPLPTRTYAKRSPIGSVETSYLTKSITKESIDKLIKTFGKGLTITSVTSNPTTSLLTFDRPHGFGRIISGTIVAGSGYTNGVFYNVKLLESSSDPGSGTWKGALATVTVSGTAVSSVNVTNGGSGYTGTESLYFDQSALTGIGTTGNGVARYNLSVSTINSNVGDVLQFTGSTATGDTYHRIQSINSPTQLTVTKSSGDIVITTSQYAFVVGKSVQLSSTSYNSSTGVSTFNTSSAHNLQIGNKFRVINSSNINQGDYVVLSITDSDTFTAYTNQTISANGGYILPHGLSSNNETGDNVEQNFSVRNQTFFERETFILDTDGGSSITIDAGTSQAARIPLGSYIQIGNEILRISGVTSDTQYNVIRALFGTRQSTHASDSIISKITPIPVEFRRSTNLRASAHTFEYLGYGPGNYSTSLPQIQVKTLSDEESLLSQSQERGAGTIVYNGINNNGDVFNGNTFTRASSGEVVSFDIPKPTITGRDSSSLISIFDQVTIKQNLLVEGGSSGTILSQFDGPVTFNKSIKVSEILTSDGNLVSNSNTTIAGNLNVAGSSTLAGEVTVNTGIIPDTDEGAYLGSVSRPFNEAYVGEITIAQSDDNTINTVTGNLILNAANTISIAKSTSITGKLDVIGITSFTGNSTVDGDLTVTGNLNVDFISAPNIAPVGAIVMWGTPSAPSNWLICNGANVSRTTYSSLFSVIGTQFGAGDGSTTFGLPNISQRIPVGAGGTYNLGNTGGSETVTLTAPQIPTHTHPFSGGAAGSHTHSGSTGSSGDHSHTTGPSGNHPHTAGPLEFRYRSGGNPGTPSNATLGFPNPVGVYGAPSGSATGTINVINSTDQGGDHNHSINSSGTHSHSISTEPNHTHPGTIGPTGSGDSHANMPPYIVLNYIIKAI